MHKIDIVGLGVAETAQLETAASVALQEAELVIGAARQLATVAHLLSIDVLQRELPKLSVLKDTIKQSGVNKVVVLASGDPLYYGIGRWFSKNFDTQSLTFHPGVSSIQAACHRLGVALQDVEVLSLHGRPLAKIRTKLKRQKQLLILTDKNSQPQHLAQACIAANFDDSVLSVCENLGYAQERIHVFTAQELASSEQAFAPLHVTHINVQGPGGVLPEFPGIPDHHYVTGAVPGKGMISKREVRLVILSHMQVSKGDIVWDIGAGCGGVAVELALWNEQADIYAIEYHPQRLDYLQQNQVRFGVVQNLHIVNGKAPKVLAQLPNPKKVFIGGSDGELQALLQQVWALLPVGGIVVSSAVTAKTKQQLNAFANTRTPSQVQSVELLVKRGSLENGSLHYVPKLAVEIFTFTKVGDV